MHLSSFIRIWLLRHLSSFTPVPVLVAQRQTMAVQKPGSPTNATPTCELRRPRELRNSQRLCADLFCGDLKPKFQAGWNHQQYQAQDFLGNFFLYHMPLKRQEHQLQNSNLQGAKAAAFSSKGPSRFCWRQLLNTCSCKLGRSPIYEGSPKNTAIVKRLLVSKCNFCVISLYGDSGLQMGATFNLL